MTAEALRLLTRAGSSLGGARPKAHVRAGDGRIAIAKFPSPSDSYDVMAWEKTAHDLAARAGIRTPRTELHSVDGRAVLVVDRFDRPSAARRLGYCSAMTMLEAQDGDVGDYVDIAAVLEEVSPTTTADLHELWLRVVFGILVSDTDDHLRNHGFLHTGSGGWTLSPAFDLNPNPEPGAHHATALAGDTSPGVETAIGLASLFRLTAREAGDLAGRTRAVVADWERVAAGNGLSPGERRAMAPAFARAA